MTSSFLPLLLSSLLLLNPLPSLALSSWYTPPGGPPAGSTAGDKIRGTNLGGWFVLENWMQPSLFAVSPLDVSTVPDEWTYCYVLGKAECAKRLQAHYSSWIVEDDFKRMADYGLNTIRLPVGYWVWNTTDEEPYVSGIQLPYIEKALNWSLSYGLDVVVDMHGLVGSQSGQDNSGRKGLTEFFYNSTNMERSLNAFQQMVQYVTQDKFEGVVKAIELVNEPYIQAYISTGMPWDTLTTYLSRAYDIVRKYEYIQPGDNVSMVIIHDAFRPLSDWDYFFSINGSTWINYALDTHSYLAFGSNSASSGASTENQLGSICSMSSAIQESQAKMPTMVGEFSLGTSTFCVDYKTCFGKSLSDTLGEWANAANSTFERAFWEVQSDVYELGAGWIFWNWNTELAPTWSYEQSVAQDWIPVDPTEKLYYFNASESFYCLNTQYPIDGDQNIPNYPTTAAVISAGTHLPVHTKAAFAANVTAAYSSTRVQAVGSNTAVIATGTGTPSLSGATTASGADRTRRSGVVGLVIVMAVGCGLLVN